MNILKDSSTLRRRALIHNLAHFSGKTDSIFAKIWPWTYLCAEKSPLTFQTAERPHQKYIQGGSGMRN